MTACLCLLDLFATIPPREKPILFRYFIAITLKQMCQWSFKFRSKFDVVYLSCELLFVTIGWLRKWREFAFNQTQSVVKQNPSKREKNNDYVRKEDLSMVYSNPGRKLGVTTHFSDNIQNNVWHFSL